MPASTVMDALSFRSIELHHAALLRQWFTHPTLQQRLEVPTDQWLQYVMSTPGVFAWMVYADTEAVGHVQVDTEANGFGSVALVVNPMLHNQGYGSAILRHLTTLPVLAALKGLEGYVEDNNLPAQRCCLAAGFIDKGMPDQSGFIRFIKLIH